MWQALLAAAVAGSTGFVARHLFNPRNDNGDLGYQRNSDPDPGEFEPHKAKKDALFRFSSGDLRNSRRRKSKKRETRVSERSTAGSESEKRAYGARRFGVSLKRRKICTNVAGKRAESCSSSQDTSLFSWGLGVGMMCMMSAGKSEFSKLNTAMAETAKVVEELKAELHKTNPSRDLLVSGHKTSLNEVKSEGQYLINDGECASSVLTEEPVQGSSEMDQLEAELEFELQKLPWSAMEASDPLVEDEISVQGFPKQMRQDYDPDRMRGSGSGILAEELDQKLCHVLIERQENKIEDLESELNLSERKLQEKEAELQALKDCVKRLTEISISTLSDDEIEEHTEQELTSNWNTTVVGMKRPIDSRFM